MTVRWRVVAGWRGSRMHTRATETIVEMDHGWVGDGGGGCVEQVPGGVSCEGYDCVEGWGGLG